ncbi:MAG: hypothetical protein M1834_006509 [Cirrosporium novae-zelandiae]|nr:MAG: hypothetical protein M1834_006509 [Cirrosporium novae-zelandiae]
MSSKITIVIVGGSYAGIAAAHAILKEIRTVKVILINPSDKFYFNIAAPRILAKPEAFEPEQYLLPIATGFSRYPKSSFEFIVGSASLINTIARTVRVGDAREVEYDYLLIASGSTTASTIGQHSLLAPFKSTGIKNIASSINSAQQKVASANVIVVAGAGPVGVEFVGELADVSGKSGGRDIILISGTSKLLPMLKDAAGDAAEKILLNKGVEIIKGQKVTRAEEDSSSGKWKVTLQNGKEITSDIYISTTGAIPNNSFIPPEFLSSEGWVGVDDGLRVKSSVGGDTGRPLPIFAIGDIIDRPSRLAMKVAEQVRVLTANLKADVLGHGKRLTYSPGQKMAMIIPVGETSGTGEMFGWVPWGKIVKMIKGKDFFVSRARTFISGK